MKIIAVANVEQQQEILEKKMNAGNEIIFKNTWEEAVNDEYDALFLLNENIHKEDVKTLKGKPVIVNSVIETLHDFPENFSRINGWPGFLKRDVWEAASNNEAIASGVFDALGWKVFFVKDEAGLIAARVISMIINEAYFALGENVSTMTDIDLAMKLGTNYPNGPFEWADKIGIQKIYELLEKLTATDTRYSIAPQLKKQLSLFTS